MNDVKQQKRVNKGYKIQPRDYDKAMKRAKKEKFPLATTIENLVIEYGRGADITAERAGLKMLFLSTKK